MFAWRGKRCESCNNTAFQSARASGPGCTVRCVGTTSETRSLHWLRAAEVPDRTIETLHSAKNVTQEYTKALLRELFAAVRGTQTDEGDTPNAVRLSKSRRAARGSFVGPLSA